MESHGLPRMSVPTVISAFERAILHGIIQHLTARMMFPKAYRHRKNKEEGMDDSGSDGSILTLSGPGRVKTMADTLRSGLAKVVGIEPNRIFSHGERLTNMRSTESADANCDIA